jgi:hypothetical protein
MNLLGDFILAFVITFLIIGISTLIIMGIYNDYLTISTFEIYLHRRQDRKRLQKQNKALKKLEGFSYPKHLVTDDDVKLYLAKNSMHLFYEDDFPIFEMIKRMSKAGWNTEIPFYSKNKYGEYVFSLISEDKELLNKLYSIIHNYQENYYVKKLYE